MSQDVKVQAAICFIAAAKFMEEHPHPFNPVTWGNACYAIAKATNDIPYTGEGHTIYQLIWDTFHDLYMKDNPEFMDDPCVYDGGFWPDDEEGYNTRIVSLLFAAHFVLES